MLFDFRDQQPASLGEFVQPRRYHVIGFRVEFTECQIVQLLAHLVHAHAACKRRVDFQGLFGRAPARFGWHVPERAHVVEPVGELDQKYPHVIGDRQEQLAEIFRLLGFLGHEVQLFQLGEAFDQRADIASKQAVDLGARGRRVLDGIVQQRGGDGRVVKLEVGQDRRHLDRMGKIRVARGAPLLAMGLHGVDVSAIEQRLVGIRIVAADPLDKVVLPHHRRLARLGGLFNRVSSGRNGRRARRPDRGLLLHARKVGARARHNLLPRGLT